VRAKGPSQRRDLLSGEWWNKIALRGVHLAAELSPAEIPDFAPSPHDEFAFFQ